MIPVPRYKDWLCCKHKVSPYEEEFSLSSTSQSLTEKQKRSLYLKQQVANEIQDKKRFQNTLKLLFVVAVPIVCLVSMALAGLVGAVKTYQKTNEGASQIHYGMKVSGLITNMQKERGLSTLYLSGNLSNEVVSRREHWLFALK